MSFFPLRHKPKNDIVIVGFFDSRAFNALLCVMKKEGGIEKVIEKFCFNYPPEHPERAMPFLGNSIRKIIAAYGIPVLTILGFCPGKYICSESLASWSIHPRYAQDALSRDTIRLYFRNAFEQHQKINCMTVAHPVGMAVNGYPQPFFFPLGGHVQEITLSAIVALFKNGLAESLLYLKELLGGIAFDYVPLAAAYLCVLDGVYKSKDAIFVDISHDTSSLFVVREGAVDALRHFEHPPISTERRDGMQNRREWKRLFLSVLEGLFHRGSLPRDVFLFGDASRTLAFSLAESSWISDFSHEKTPRIRAVHGSNLFGGESFNGILSGHNDARLASLLYYAAWHKKPF